VDKYLDIRKMSDFKIITKAINISEQKFFVCNFKNHVHDTTGAEELVSIFGLPDPEDKDSTVRRNVKNYLPDDKRQYPTRLDPQPRLC
jgi:hypothetical protein